MSFWTTLLILHGLLTGVRPSRRTYTMTRTIVTSLLAAIVWYALITGHVLNDIRGFRS